MCADLPEGTVIPLVRLSLRGWIGFVEASSVDWLSRRTVHRSVLVAFLGNVLLSAVTLAGLPPLPTG